ncbi:hypothetical protein NOF04DRAFT_16665 [Fusarium oxysporum II5]|uniref:Uncharacterized protein n=1 Tax=Fusarium odoratissimum (strain NRRL 54006) TaxID=1089451 RepID=X0K3J4_FUSO5|nr:uncharacterized protein FOIG_15166 [Fusarium odoratissimum NRRL 54006]EXL91629.1 hypothetical protein FOIG_15166 [Fusarium odoratissimum NRRL 54006]KAK2133214.1 hypothetical protein NOF04DRAFT_16665 [Fusarium oxysporum II5]
MARYSTPDSSQFTTAKVLSPLQRHFTSIAMRSSKTLINHEKLPSLLFMTLLQDIALQPNSLDLDYGLPSGPFEVDMVNPNNEFALASLSHVDESISIIMCHSTTTELLMITSMAFEYAEGHEPMYFGPFAISEPEHEKNVSKQDRCTCIHEGSFEVEIEDLPHFEIGGWNPNGAYLKTLRLWVDSLGILTSLQFVTEASESQKWGFCEGEHSAELDLRTKEETTAGIKFFLDSNGRNDVGEDTVVVAVQLIEVKKPAPKPKPPKMKKYKISK